MSALPSSLQNPTLVLNKGWMPVNIIPAYRAVCLTFSGKAKIIDPSLDFQQFNWSDWSDLRPQADEQAIRAGEDLSFRIPWVILLKKYDKYHDRGVNFSRRELYRRDDFQCQYCGGRPGSKELSVDHIIPRSQGGQTTWENCVVACVECNAKKADLSLKQTGMKLLRKPYKPRHKLYRGTRQRMPEAWESWEHLISEAYWEVELENDND